MRDDDGEALLIDVDATETVHALRRGQSERSTWRGRCPLPLTSPEV